MAQYKRLNVSALLIASVISSASYGAGFSIMEQSVTGLGRAFAGQAAVAEDASTIFFNPAGLTYLTHSQIAQGMNFILPRSEFNNEGSSLPAALGGTALTGSEDDAGKLALVPNFYYAHRLNDDVVLGLGVNAPFGLVTEYTDQSVGRYHAIKSDLLTININPSMGFKATDRLSLGFGLNLQYIDLELTQAVDFGAACAQASVTQCAQPQQHDGKATLTADDWSWGFNLGLMFQATEATRLALAYRSKISHHLTGKGQFDIPSNPFVQAVAAGGGFVDGSISGDINLPESASFAVHHQINNKWAVSADVTWTRWERFQELNISSPIARLNSVKEEKWGNNVRYGVGLTYIYNDKWTFRSGIAYDQSPISDQYRTARIPGEDRKWLSVGASYNYSDNITLDAGYTHIFVTDPSINDATAQGYTLSGEYDANVDIVGVQMRWLFI
ncbi:MAG: long-chain fatty acid transporter [Gammaproteobacteria bacterium]|nr:MAG: long-chain fatty acid transporter [Gammaproteobacteria bacterium]